MKPDLLDRAASWVLHRLFAWGLWLDERRAAWREGRARP